MLVDSHCHLNLLDLNSENNLNWVFEQCKINNIEYLLSVATELNTFNDLLNIANKYNNVVISAGLHPNDTVDLDSKFIKNDLYNILFNQSSNKKVVAIGETGLDYYRTDNKKKQWQCFGVHIELAKTIKKPLIIHTRNAAADTIKLMHDHSADQIGGVMHCFTESWEVAKQALDLGFYISISGIVTFKNAKQVQEVAQKVPIDRLLIETDCPYLAPMPHRGKQNFPHYVKHVAEKIADLRGIEFSVVANYTTQNFYNLFKINNMILDNE